MTSIVDSSDAYLRIHRPTLDEILGASCQLYRIDPDEIDQKKATVARRAYCYLAERWAGVSMRDIATRVGVMTHDVGVAAHTVETLRHKNFLLRDDLDLMTLGVLERVMLRKRFGND